MPRCPSCNKFASYEAQEPEIEVEADASAGSIGGNCRIVLACQEDGEELKEATLAVDVDCGEFLNDHADESGDQDGTEHELSVEVEDAETSERSEGTGRGRKTFYGASATFRVTCSCGELDESFKWDDDIQASHMDELT